jgi:hypothetical protein
MMFEIGQQVVCIVADWCEGCTCGGKNCTPYKFPIKGFVYTIRAIGPSSDPEFNDPDWVGVTLEEIVNPLDEDNKEILFCTDGFRPIKKTSIDVFRQMLTPRPEDVLT